jgi:endogenous inhibitor of DNA gyrase (YacG/DUF329 family)
MKCPVCGKPVTWDQAPNRPFCSERCRLLDLANWADEKYRLPSQQADSEDDVEQERCLDLNG